MGAPAANILETKILVNITIPDDQRGARFMLADLKGFFLATLMDIDEYMKVQYKDFLADIKEQYALEKKVSKLGHIFYNR